MIQLLLNESKVIHGHMRQVSYCLHKYILAQVVQANVELVVPAKLLGHNADQGIKSIQTDAPYLGQYNGRREESTLAENNARHVGVIFAIRHQKVPENLCNKD